MEAAVIHEEKYQQFTIRFENEEDEAELAYALSDDGVINFSHTYVPEFARGRGLVEKLIAEGLRFASEKKYEVRATCPVAAKYIERRGK